MCVGTSKSSEVNNAEINGTESAMLESINHQATKSFEELANLFIACLPSDESGARLSVQPPDVTVVLVVIGLRVE